MSSRKKDPRGGRRDYYPCTGSWTWVILITPEGNTLCPTCRKPIKSRNGMVPMHKALSETVQNWLDEDI